MKISRQTWHFRMYRFLISLWTEGDAVFRGRRTYHEPRDLCHYFWTIVILVISMPIWIVGALFILILLAIVLGAHWIAMRTVVPMWHRFSAWRDSRDETRAIRRAEKGPKQPGLVKTYVKARKSKVCPIIEVVE